MVGKGYTLETIYSLSKYQQLISRKWSSVLHTMIICLQEKHIASSSGIVSLLR